MNASTTSTGNKTRLPKMTATTTGRWGKLRTLFSGLTRCRNKYIPLEMRWKWAWGKRNEWSLRNGNDYYPKLSGAEVYAWNEGKMKCGWVEVRNLTATQWRRKGMHLPQAWVKSTRHIFIFGTTNGWWGLWGTECWKAGNNYRRIILAFQHYQTLSLSIFGMEWGL